MKRDMGGARDTYGGGHKYNRLLVGKAERKRPCARRECRWGILKWISERWDGRE
jgi:hypothetical protein